MTSIPGRGEIVESENPLDVLSRAATMVEKSEISPRLSPPIVEKTKSMYNILYYLYCDINTCVYLYEMIYHFINCFFINFFL